MEQFDPTRPNLYYINFMKYRVGRFEIYIRSKIDDGGTFETSSKFPIEIYVYSDLASSLYSSSRISSKYVGEIVVDLTAKDMYGNVLTDGGVLFNTTVEYVSYGENPEPATLEGINSQSDGSFYQAWADEFTPLEYSVYRAVINPVRRGFYNVTSWVCEAQDNECSFFDEYVQLEMSPQTIYLTTKHISEQTTIAFG